MPPRKQLTVLYYNARSILPKWDELRAGVLFQKPDIIFIVETWLSEDVTDYGVGVVLYVHNSLSCKPLLKGGAHNSEFLAPSVTSALVANKFCICLFYRPPSSSFLFLITFVQHYR